jgi:hypothetical protein
MASGDDYTGALIDSMGALLVGSRTYAESERTMEWFGTGPCSSEPVYVLTSRELPIAASNITLTDASPQLVHLAAGQLVHPVSFAGQVGAPPHRPTSARI